jgi:entry exclusion lipoprotein TrbK
MKNIWIFFFAFALASCGEDKNTKAGLPEVNESNCHPQNIEKLPTKKQREEFSSLCFKQGDWHKKSSERKW